MSGSVSGLQIFTSFLLSHGSTRIRWEDKVHSFPYWKLSLEILHHHLLFFLKRLNNT